MSAAGTHWAILIGVNFHKQQPLYGCVRDVELIKGCLQKHLITGSKPPSIVTLTASNPEEPETCFPPEPPESWPTYANVTSAFEAVMTEAQAGDFVYIHYSGHGTRPVKAQNLSNENEYGQDEENLALILFDSDNGSRYLYGDELAYLLDKMVNTGLLVTLVLDCCFSGSVRRHGNLQTAGIRTVPYDNTIAALSRHKPRNSFNHRIGQVRGAHNLSIADLLIKSTKSYTILAACSPHEIAEELIITTGKAAGQKQGALSFFLAFALLAFWKSSKPDVAHQSLYRHLCVQFHVNWPKQTPMRYGNKDLAFFGKPNPAADEGLFPVFRTTTHSRLQLGAGLAHGICEGDEVALYPFDSPEDASLQTTTLHTGSYPLLFKVESVRGLTSNLVEKQQNSTPKNARGWKARLLTRLSSRKIPVRLMPTVGDSKDLATAIEKKRFVTLPTDELADQACPFHISLSDQNEYEILDESGLKIPTVPTMPSQSSEAIESVATLLEHLATFKYFQGIHNRASTAPLSLENDNTGSFVDLFTLCLADREERSLLEMGTIEVKEEDPLILTILNLSDHPLYITILDLGPEWQIDSLLSQEGGAGFTVVPSKSGSQDSKEEIKWSMSVPESFKQRGVCYCTDLVKVFVTTKPTWVAPMLLPEISNFRSNVGGAIRGAHDHMSKFLSRLSMPLRGGYDDDAWSVHDFLIRTTADNCEVH